MAVPQRLAAANDLKADASIESGDELVVPVANAIAAPHPQHYVTRPGDTLVTVADRFNVSVENLRRWNHLSSSAIKPHRTLYVDEPVRLAPTTHVRARGSHTRSSTATKASPAVPRQHQSRLRTIHRPTKSASKKQHKASNVRNPQAASLAT